MGSKKKDRTKKIIPEKEKFLGKADKSSISNEEKGKEENVDSQPESNDSRDAESLHDCKKDNCSYYVNKNAMLLNKNKFIIVVIVSVVILTLIHIHMNMDLHRRYKAIMEAGDLRISTMIDANTQSRDSLYYFYINDNILNELHTSEQDIKQMLELEYAKIQSEYATLSLWAGIVMIVFLIISLYSIFKIDEIQKQSREELRQIRTTANDVQAETEKIDKKIGEAFEKIESSAERELKKLMEEFSSKSTSLKEQYDKDIESMDQMITSRSKKFGDIVNNKSEAFDKSYNEYLSKMKEANENNQKQFDALLALLSRLVNRDSESSSSNNSES